MTHTQIAHPSLRKLLGLVGDSMTSAVITVPPQMPASEAAIEMSREGVAGAPVVDAGVIVGIVTLGDMLDKIGHSKATTTGPFLRTDRHLMDFCVADLMTRDVVSVVAEMPLADAVLRMDVAGVNRLPVLDAAGRPVGILARDDVVRALARALRHEAAEGRSAGEPGIPLIPPD